MGGKGDATSGVNKISNMVDRITGSGSSLCLIRELNLASFRLFLKRVSDVDL